MTIDFHTNAFGKDVASSETREEALAKILRRKILVLYNDQLGGDAPIKRLIGSSAEIQSEFAKILAEAEVTLQDVEDAIVEKFLDVLAHIEARAFIVAANFAKNNAPKQGAATAIYGFIPIGQSRNTYLLKRAPGLQALADRINAQHGAQGVKAEIRIYERSLPDGRTNLNEEVCFVISKSPA
jgi:hypothetical protein